MYNSKKEASKRQKKGGETQAGEKCQEKLQDDFKPAGSGYAKYSCGKKLAYKEAKRCRVSGRADLVQVVDIGTQALSGIFPKEKDALITAGPLQLRISTGSGLLQLAHSYDIEEMYGDTYGYRSGLNRIMIEHLRAKQERLCNAYQLEGKRRVVDIGSNDGTLLNFYREDWDRIGVDPSSKKYREFYKEGIHRYETFFDMVTALRIKDEHGEVDLVTSIAMFYDLESPRDFVKAVKSVLAPEGIWHFEQSYMPTMLRTNAYDTICHEHLEYYSLEVVAQLLSSEGLRVIDVELNSVNGGSFAVTAARKDSKWVSNTPVIDWLLRQEKAFCLSSPAPYRKFEENIYRHRDELRYLINELQASGKSICGYGASTKGNTLLQLCGFSEHEIRCIGDVNPDKHGCYTPGTGIPIVSESECKDSNPDYFLVLPWHFREGILSREEEARKKGIKFIFPLPEIEIV